MTVFSGIKIESCGGVYAPAEDSFLLAESIGAQPDDSVLDMGCGSGFLGLIAAKTARWVLSVDISDSARECALENARLNCVENLEVRKSDLFSNVSETFDLIVFNPPYLPTEEGEPLDDVSLAWDGGRSGRVVIDRFLAGLSGHLNPGGRVVTLGSSLSDFEKTISVLEGMGFQVSLPARRKLDFEELVVIRGIYDF
ncbi:MAG TPA: methyltransferase domain-containing protein [Euryarchaeota archaeon]|nr:ribosomal protein L11 methyltransferase [archaeon BMS3Abin16]GBE55968.1 ribosomal protein L11 methyltransferase [archaeon BMS3Bbin16]HDH28016.1 methyltransferase domain-containing protein [Euryarchaeota archaeon]HDY73972.1 methyltransferase domain-containing protein [Euryarchaeota archaeon]